ncbi:hypothetical protein [Actinopolymorpha alba]|uniref:hypothetical protein n=1 Tax=Actinopolymorpha alba TaxID=533267 RepID=UPI00036CBD91|nr:hypothetical protein [Actinopolymorpha alba]
MAASLKSVVTVIEMIAAAHVSHGPHDDLLNWSVEDWRKVLLELPLDGGTFAAQFELSWDSSIAALERWCVEFRTLDGSLQARYAELFGYLSIFLTTMISLRHSELRRSASQDANTRPPEGSRHDCDRVCRPLFEDEAVREALRRIYAPPAGSRDSRPIAGATYAQQEQAIREWANIDFDTLRFHRHGTTSFILAGQPRRRIHGQLRPFALKCIVYPFLRIPTIGRATRSYADTYKLPAADVEHLVWVWASSDGWILMDFVAGQTLAERIEAEATPRRARYVDAFFLPEAGDHGRTDSHTHLRLDLIERFGQELFLALTDLERCGLSHCDLSPSNIIVVKVPNEDRETLKLIDLGVNYLYQHDLPGRGGVDAVFVAPEIRARTTDPATAVEGTSQVSNPGESRGYSPTDLYSFGQLLIMVGTGQVQPDGTVPGLFYAEAPLIARFIEDLTDRSPDRRLVIFGPKSETPESFYNDLRDYFVEELDAVKAAEAEKLAPHRASAWSGIADVFQPLSGALGRQWRLWQVRRQQELYRDPRRNMRVRWLLAWSTVSAACWALTATIVLMWTLRNAGLDWDNQIIVLFRKLLGAEPDEFPLLDQLRADDYEPPLGAESTALGLLGLSFTLVGVKYYQSLFAAVSPMVVGWRAGSLTAKALLAECSMRAWAIVPLATILPPLLIQPRWWPIFVAASMTFVTLSNWASSLFGRSALGRAREYGLSTVPGHVSGINTYTSWIPGNTFYALTLWIVGTLLYIGAAQDTMVYIIAIMFVNVVQLYVVKCGLQGPDIRAGLSRACIAAERLRYAMR